HLRRQYRLMPSSPDQAGDLWTFATRAYAEPGVAEACLRLQDEAGADVCLLFAALWSAACGPGLLGPEDLDALDDLVAPWREQVVRPLRQARRWMKAAGHDPDPLRDRIKAAELAAEERELATMARWLGRLPA